MIKQVWYLLRYHTRYQAFMSNRLKKSVFTGIGFWFGLSRVII
ncbi:hypothetical protein [Paenibacillus turpanensis]|nr:hypothetical protein [Paenibacillus turpanensis]